MSCIAIIPARGGSKRLPKKNSLSLGGKPLLVWVVEACLASGCFGKVIVSSEDEDMLNFARDAGAIAYVRPEELAQDRATVVEVCLDVLEHFECETFCCVYATSALLSPDTLQQAVLALADDKNTNVLMGVSEYNYSPVQAIVIGAEDFAEMLLPGYMKIQSQFHPKTRVSNGTFCLARKESFLIEKTFYSERLKVYDVPEVEVCDLDTPQDLQKLKQMFKASR